MDLINEQLPFYGPYWPLFFTILSILQLPVYLNQFQLLPWFDWIHLKFELIFNYWVYAHIRTEQINQKTRIQTIKSIKKYFWYAICICIGDMNTWSVPFKPFFLFQIFHIILFLWGITGVMTTSSIHKQIWLNWNMHIAHFSSSLLTVNILIPCQYSFSSIHRLCILTLIYFERKREKKIPKNEYIAVAFPYNVIYSLASSSVSELQLKISNSI